MSAPNNSFAGSDARFPVGSYLQTGWDPCTCDDLQCVVNDEAGTIDKDL